MFNNKSKNKILSFIFFLASFLNIIASILDFREGKVLSALTKLMLAISTIALGISCLLPKDTPK